MHEFSDLNDIFLTILVLVFLMIHFLSSIQNTTPFLNNKERFIVENLRSIFSLVSTCSLSCLISIFYLFCSLIFLKAGKIFSNMRLHDWSIMKLLKVIYSSRSNISQAEKKLKMWIPYNSHMSRTCFLKNYVAIVMHIF